MAKIDSGSMSKQKGSTTAKGSYSIDKVGDNVKVKLAFSVKKTGVSGTGKGWMGFALLDENGEKVFMADKGFTVGAELDGLAKKNFGEELSIFGNKAIPQK